MGPRERWRLVLARLHCMCTIGALTLVPAKSRPAAAAAAAARRGPPDGERSPKRARSECERSSKRAPAGMASPPASAVKGPAASVPTEEEFAMAFTPPPALREFCAAGPELRRDGAAGVNLTYSWYGAQAKLQTRSVTIPGGKDPHELSEADAATVLTLGELMHVLQMKELARTAADGPVHDLPTLRRIAAEERSWLHMLLHGLMAGPQAWGWEKERKRVRPYAGASCAPDGATNGELAALVAAEIMKKAVDRRRVEPMHLFLAEVLEAHNTPEHVRRLLVDLGMSASRDCVRSRQAHTISGSMTPDEAFQLGSAIFLLFDKCAVPSDLPACGPVAAYLHPPRAALASRRKGRSARMHSILSYYISRSGPRLPSALCLPPNTTPLCTFRSGLAWAAAWSAKVTGLAQKLQVGPRF